METFESIETLQQKLGEMLVGGPLYRVLSYKSMTTEGKDLHYTVRGAYGTARRAKLPAEVKMFCPSDYCGQDTWWGVDNADVHFNDGEFIQRRKYTCKNCEQSNAHYCFVWQDQKDQNAVFVKVGQYPELEERIPEHLRAALDAPNLKFYKNALRMRNFNLGLAAAAYMRRVIENRMNEMLDILYEAAVAHNMAEELLKRHQEVKAEKRFSVKIDYAGDLLPAYLRPTGKPNPMQVLHELTSDGLHARSDEECVDIFDACRKTFEFVFGKVRIETEEAKAFVQGMATLAEKRNKGAKVSEGK